MPALLPAAPCRGRGPPIGGRAARNHPARPPPRPPPTTVARTSEFWYDDEEEFDAIAGDSLRPKRVTIVGGETGGAGAGDATGPAFDACFHAPGPAPAAAAAALWAGRSGPPFFIKPRARPALATDPAAAWAELAGQNWRAAALLVGLDAATTASAEAPEELLVVVEGAGGVDRLLGAAGLAAPPPPAAGDAPTVVVALDGWTGDGVAPIPPWTSLNPRVL